MTFKFNEELKHLVTPAYGFALVEGEDHSQSDLRLFGLFLDNNTKNSCKIPLYQQISYERAPVHYLWQEMDISP